MEKFKLDNRVGGRIEIKRSVDDGKTWTPVVFVNADDAATLARDIVVMMNILADHRVNHCPCTFGLYQPMDCTENSEDGYSDECDNCWDNALEKAAGEAGE